MVRSNFTVSYLVKLGVYKKWLKKNENSGVEVLITDLSSQKLSLDLLLGKPLMTSHSVSSSLRKVNIYRRN